MTHRAPGEAAGLGWTTGEWLLFGLSVVSLQSYSLNIGGIGVSVNYFFVFIPLFMALAGSPRPIVIRREAASALLIFGLIYLVGLRFDIAALDQGIEPAVRRFASFIAFLLPFSLAFVRFKPSDLVVFKMAVVSTAAWYSAQSIMRAIPLLLDTPVEQLKAIIGSQRYGFVLCLALFIVLYADRLVFRRALNAQRFALSALLIAGISLTFSRASLVASGVGVVVATASAGWGVLAGRAIRRRRPGRRRFSTVGALITLGLVLAVLVSIESTAVTGIWGFYMVAFTDPGSDLSVMSRLIEADVSTSEGYRAYMVGKVMEYLGAHPLMGSSFQGVYLMFEEFRGTAHSAHGQYLDIVARTGILGLTVWSALLARIVWFCRRDRGLLAGIVGVVAYGLFHETFKLSQGGFIFAMLLSFAYLPASAWQVPAAPVAGR